MLEQQVIAVQIILHPAWGVLQRDSVYMHLLAVDDSDQERPPRCAMDGFVAWKIGGAAPSVNLPFTA
ncbi:hypothetical protein D3C87_2087300 [compost metagenome]